MLQNNIVDLTKIFWSEAGDNSPIDAGARVYDTIQKKIIMVFLESVFMGYWFSFEMDGGYISE